MILNLYGEFGVQFVQWLDGMFAFAIVRGDELFMARDPLGIKPLYFGERDGVCYFASVVKVLASERARLAYQWNYRLPNKEALYYYRILRQDYRDEWIFPNMGSSRSL